LKAEGTRGASGSGNAGSRFKFAPILTATVLTVLLLWLFKTVAQVFLLLFVSVLISLYLGAVASWFERRVRMPSRVALAAAISASLGALVLLGLVLIPPTIQQTRDLIEQLPSFITSWESGINNFVKRFPALAQNWRPEDHRVISALYDQLSGTLGNIVPRVFGIVHAAINVFAIGVMSIYLALHPTLYREWLIALFPPIHRDLVRDVLSDLGDSLRAYIVGQIMTMAFLGALTALGLFVLKVPFSLPFGIFTGLVAIVPFFGTLVSTTLPALFVLNGPGVFGFSGFGHALLVVGLGVVIHLIEGNVVAPLVMSRKVDLPPVLTIMAVLVMGAILGGAGLVVALPTLVALMVIVRRILITRIYEGQGFRRTTRERPLMLRLPAPGGGVLAPIGPSVDIVTVAEREGVRRSA
jgi:predicted PurR-regulated permease PerM